jgi:hypothetical protein
MEFSKKEVAEISKVVESINQPIQELSELQLALVGGGMGETILA